MIVTMGRRPGGSSLLVLVMAFVCAAATTTAEITTTATTTGGSRFTPMDSLFTEMHGSFTQDKPIQDQQQQQQRLKMEDKPSSRRAGPASEEEEDGSRARRVREAMHGVRPVPGSSTLERVPEAEFEALQRDHPSFRQLWGGGSGGNGNQIRYADPGNDYDMWQQGYRMLGGFIDCDHQKDEGSGDHDNDGGNNGGGGSKSGACSRWMMWASYVDPNYQGYGYDEYFGEEPVGVLDCHKPDTDWVLLGVYRQEFYQFIEQISKHLWAIDEYEYVVALAGLKYMTKYDCFYVGASSSGQSIYAGVAPQPYGDFQMALYTDDYCLTPNTNLGMTYDDFGLTSDMNLGSKDQTDDDKSWAEEWWSDTQEYTLAKLNEVYHDYMFCTSCIDYPTYQDGYVIGDTGMDEDDLINQCWKFYSHDSFPCESDCIALGHSQGTILSVVVGSKMYGQALQAFYYDVSGASSSAIKESQITRLLANAFVTFSFVVFVATFLAFAVARRSRYRESRGAKSRRLLDDDDDKRSSRRRKSTGGRSTRRGDEEGDGVFRSSVGGSRKSRSKSSKRKSSTSVRSHSRARENSNDDDYEPPRRSRSRKRSSSRARPGDY